MSDAKIDPGGGANLTAPHFHPAGEDAQPLPGDQLAAIPVAPRGSFVVLGYLDATSPKAGPGEKRIFARGGDGEPIVEVWLKADGSAVLVNALGSIELEPAGDCVINGVRIDVNGVVTSPTQIISPLMTVDGKELKNHEHAILGGSSAPGPTGPNT